MNNRIIITGLSLVSIAFLALAILNWWNKEKEREEKNEARQAARQNGKVAHKNMEQLQKKEEQRQELEGVLSRIEQKMNKEQEPVGYDTPSKRELMENG